MLPIYLAPLGITSFHSDSCFLPFSSQLHTELYSWRRTLSISYPELEDKKCVYILSLLIQLLTDWLMTVFWWMARRNKWTLRKYMTWNPENQIIFLLKNSGSVISSESNMFFLWGLTKDSKVFQHMLRMGLKVGIAICGYLQKSLLSFSWLKIP